MRFKIIIPLLGLLFAFGPAKLRHGLRNLFSLKSEVFTAVSACEGLATNIKAYPGLVSDTAAFIKVLQSWPGNGNSAESAFEDDLSDAWISHTDLVDSSSLHDGEHFREEFQILMHRLNLLNNLLSNPSASVKLIDHDLRAIKNFNLTIAGYEQAAKIIEMFQQDLSNIDLLVVQVMGAVTAAMENINRVVDSLDGDLTAMISDTSTLDIEAFSPSEVHQFQTRIYTRSSSRNFLCQKAQMIVERLSAFPGLFTSREANAMTTALREVELERTKWDTCVQSCQSAQCDIAVEEFISALAAVL